MLPFEQKISDTIACHGLLSPGASVFVALSGGADSVALLTVLVALGYDVSAIHCNFHLRGGEADRDMRHAGAVCGRLGVPVEVYHFDVAAWRRKTGESVEMACRTLRYDVFCQIGAPVAVAHHSEDNVETFFINLLRSTGIDGLTGMAWRNGNIVRPMLGVAKSEILDYLVQKGMDYVTDSSNALNDFRRNRLRNVVLPVLEDNFPGAAAAVTTTMTHLGDAALLVDDAVAMWVDRAGGNDCRLDVARLVQLAGEERARFVVFRHFRGFGLNGTQADDIVRGVVAGRSGQRFELGARTAVIDRGVLTVTDMEDVDDREWPVNLGAGIDATDARITIDTPIAIEASFHPVETFRPGRNPRVACFDASIVRGGRLFLRHPRVGDRFRPFGMRGTKLLSDLFTDLKMSRAERCRQWVLTCNDEIVWVVGVRAADAFRITASTTTYVRLEAGL